MKRPYDIEVIPVFFEDDSGGWWWYNRDRTREHGAHPTHGPFDIESLARKHCNELHNQLRQWDTTFRPQSVDIYPYIV